MNSEIVKDIKEYLQEEVFIATKFEDTLRRISTRDLQKILTLINELESENERLEKELKQVVLCNKGLQDGINEYQADNKEMGKSNQKLKERIAELEKENARLIKKNNHLLDRNRDLIRVCDACKISLKQFAERLKEKCNDKNTFICSNSITATEIDETLKEMIEDDK